MSENLCPLRQATRSRRRENTNPSANHSVTSPLALPSNYRVHHAHHGAISNRSPPRIPSCKSRGRNKTLQRKIQHIQSIRRKRGLGQHTFLNFSMTSVAFSTFSSPQSALDGTGFARKTTPVDSSHIGNIPMDRVAVIAASPKLLHFFAWLL